MFSQKKNRLGDWLISDENQGSLEDAQAPFDQFGPISELRRLRQEMRQTQQIPHDCPRILVAEAEPYHRRVLRVLLANPGISAIEVEDGQSAVDLLSLRSFDLILVSMNLPIMTGFDVVRWVRRSHTPWSDIPILGMVDDAHRAEVGRLMSAGMTDWTPKPLNRGDLAGKLVGLLPSLSESGL